MSDGIGGNYVGGSRAHRLPNKITNEFIEYII